VTGSTAAAGASPEVAGVSRREVAALAVIIALAALLRYAFLPTRGEFDADQGHDMLVLRDLVTSGIVPLLGPPTSVGAGHHGALYYWLLAPAAAIGGADSPTAVVAFIAALGVAAVALTWWLARSIAGAVAGLSAALILAVSSTAIGTATFLWNPSLMPAASALAFVGARLAWRDRRARWWLVAAFGAMVTMQCHTLGAVIIPPLAALWLAAAVRAGPGLERRRHLLAGLGVIAVLAAGYLPLVAHELGSGLSETHAVLDYVARGGEPSSLDPMTRILVVLVRVVGWPLVGPLAAYPPANGLALVLVWAIVVWRLVRGRGDERLMIAWLGWAVAFAAVFLGVLVPSSAIVTPLPVDHYHAELDPVVATIVGIGVAALARGRRGTAAGSRARLFGPAAAVLVVGVIVGWNALRVPPPVNPRGDWSAALAAADRIAADARAGGTIALLSVPAIKGTDADGFPLTLLGIRPSDPATAGTVVVLCEDLWAPDCGGAAEIRALSAAGDPTAFSRVDSWSPAPGRTATVFARR
jgi:4-amino-4-deoxy-L-arabinose transferase-like glycosyltransferase